MQPKKPEIKFFGFSDEMRKTNNRDRFIRQLNTSIINAKTKKEKEFFSIQKKAFRLW